MTDYVEEFVINDRVYGIEASQDGQQFCLWSGGCLIGLAKSITEARKILHDHAVSQLSAEAHGYRERTIKAEAAIYKLGDDSFNLGMFKIGKRPKKRS